MTLLPPQPGTYAQGEIFRTALKMKQELPNDQDFGRQFRKLLQDFQDGKILQPVPSVQFDEKIVIPDSVEITNRVDMNIYKPYVVRDKKLLQVATNLIVTGEIYAYVQRGPESTVSGIPDIIIIKYKKVEGGATEVDRIVNFHNYFTPEGMKNYLTNHTHF